MQNKNEIVTVDLSEFGYIELREASKLLIAYYESKQNFLGDGLMLNFNKNSGYVFLCDEDYNVGLLTDDGKLEQFFSCPNCGAEGFKENIIEIENHQNNDDDECNVFIKEIKRVEE
ncbi:MAG: hypothetical protein AABY22_32905 [Nanoarchaeota archaeon]